MNSKGQGTFYREVLSTHAHNPPNCGALRQESICARSTEPLSRRNHGRAPHQSRAALAIIKLIPLILSLSPGLEHRGGKPLEATRQRKSYLGGSRTGVNRTTSWDLPPVSESGIPQVGAFPLMAKPGSSRPHRPPATRETR